MKNMERIAEATSVAMETLDLATSQCDYIGMEEGTEMLGRIRSMLETETHRVQENETEKRRPKMNKDRKYVSSAEILDIAPKELEAIQNRVIENHKKSDTSTELARGLYADMGVMSDRDRQMVATGFALNHMLIAIQMRHNPIKMMNVLMGPDACVGGIEMSPNGVRFIRPGEADEDEPKD